MENYLKLCPVLLQLCGKVCLILRCRVYQVCRVNVSKTTSFDLDSTTNKGDIYPPWLFSILFLNLFISWLVKPFIGDPLEDPKNLGQKDEGTFREHFEPRVNFADANFEF